ncbi:MAG: tetratricopeptide (TPR) repeat protein, partial [Glaciecola sp.]
LLPALELKIEALQLAKNTSQTGPATVLERLRLVGADSKSQLYLSKYPTERFSKLEQLELIRLDPYGLGRSRVAQWLFEQGHPERVLLVLRPIPDHQDPPALQAMRIQALLATERYDQAIEEAAPWLQHPSIGMLCQRLTIRAHLAQGNSQGVAQGLRVLLARGPQQPAERRELAKDLVHYGMLEAATPVLAQLDRKRGWRTPSVIEWSGLCASAAGQTDKSQEFLTRAVPFFDNGRIELLQAILSAGDRDWPSMPIRIQRLDDSDFSPSPFQAAAVALLGERIQAGIELIERGVERNPNSVSWALLNIAAHTLDNAPSQFAPQFGASAAEQARALLVGSGDLRRDPRDTIAMLLALDLDPWQTWTEVRAQKLASDLPQNLWLGWMIAEAQFRSGRLQQAQVSFSELITQFPLCAPLWDSLFAVFAAQHPDNPLHPDILAARSDQALAIPLRKFLSPNQIAMGLAGQATAQGHPDQAIATLRRFLKATGEGLESESRWMLGRLLAEQGQFSQALDQFERVLTKSQPRGLHPWVPEYLDWLDKCHLDPTAPLHAADIASRLETLVHRYPSDPQLALQRLMYRVESDERSVLLASDEALASMAMLRSLAPNNSIDSLRPGSNRAWMEYMLSVSPILGEEYCWASLDLNPGNLDMWIGLSYALQTQGRISETRTLVADLLKISDDPELHYRLASLLALEGESAKIVNTHLQRGDKLSGAKSASPRNRFTKAQTTLLHGARGLDTVVRDLGALWPDRDQFSREVPPLDLGRVYLTALILRHQAKDLQTVERVTEDLLQYIDQDPYSEDLIRSFRAVAHSIESRLLVKAKE